MPRPLGSKNKPLSKEEKLLRRRIRERAARQAKAATTHTVVTANKPNAHKAVEAQQVFHIYIGSGAA